MLKKLLKYDMREIKRRSLPFYLASGAASLLCCGLLFFARSFQGENGGFAMYSVMSLYAIGIFSIFAIFVVNSFFAIMRYYKSFFSDEGYLNMVIPADTGKLLLAKTISGYIWVLVSFAVMLLSFGIAAIVPNLLYDPKGFFLFADGILSGNGTDFLFGAIAVILGCIQLFVSVFEAITVVFASVTIGSIAFSKHRIIGSVLIYMAISFVHSGVVGVTESLVVFLLVSESTAAFYFGQIISIAVSAAVSAVMYAINLGRLKTGFNIE